MADGWFDDPIGLLARAYILVPLKALGKFLWLGPPLILRSNFSPIPELTRRHPIGYYSALPSHTLMPHSSTSMSPHSMLTRRPLIGRPNHGVVFPPVLILL